jgi:hypothetical protein
MARAMLSFPSDVHRIAELKRRAKAAGVPY